jgi:hypothetical protein
VTDPDAERLDREIDRISADLPSGAGRFLRWLREPSSHWVRVPVALLLLVGGIVGFLPVLGFWMVPLGILLLAQDAPFLRRPILQALAWLEKNGSNGSIGSCRDHGFSVSSARHPREEGGAPKDQHFIVT